MGWFGTLLNVASTSRGLGGLPVTKLGRCSRELFLTCRSPLTDDRDSLAPTRFGDGACAAATIERPSSSATLTGRAGPARSSGASDPVNEALSALGREFAGLYSPIGRPSIPQEKLLRAMLLQAVYAIRSELGGHAERVAARHMIEPRADRPTAITLGADKAYDAEDFVN